MTNNQPSTGTRSGRASTEVSPRATRRKFSAEYKQSILDEVDRCTMAGEIGALLRREGLYSSLLSKWREQRSAGGQEGLAPRKRGPKASVPNPLEKQVRELERENAKLRKRAERAEGLIEVQKKVAELLGTTLPDPEDTARSS